MDLDDDSRKDLMEAFIDLQAEVESSLVALLKEWDDKDVNRLFRAVHNIKGNAGIMGLGVIVNFTHEVEEVIGALRQKRFPLNEAVAETLLLAMDRLHDLHQQELYNKKFDYLRIDETQLLYRALAESGNDESEQIAQQILHILGAGIVDAEVDLFSMQERELIQPVDWLVAETIEEKRQSDLLFFQELALQLDNQVDSWNGRSIQLFQWAMTMNQLAGSPVDAEQFAAAIYMHDFGMSLMPTELWVKKLDLNPEEIDSVARHPEWGYNYLVRVPGWEEAATIVHHHHECVDGSGYPGGLKSAEIHAGAKILAILDTFFFLTNGRVDSSARRSTVRAVSAINARVDTDFEGMWVQCFNHMIRKELKDGRV